MKKPRFKDRTRGGTPVRIYATDGSIEAPIHGAARVGEAEEWRPFSWAEDGSFDTEPHYLDLIPVEPERIDLGEVEGSPMFKVLLSQELSNKVRGKRGRLIFEVEGEEG